MEKSQHTDFNEDTTNESASVATYGCESWTLRKNEETRLDALEMKGLKKILRVSWTAKKTNEWVLNKAGVKREPLDTVKARKLAYTVVIQMKKQGSCLEKMIIQGIWHCIWLCYARYFQARKTRLFVCVCLYISVSVTSWSYMKRLSESSWRLAWELPSTYPTLRYMTKFGYFQK